ncbi:MAG: DNA ligase, partial [Candidatus Eremiobacterota bacterium]
VEAELARLEQAGADPQVAAPRREASPAGDKPAASEPPLLLAQRWDSVQDLTGWWMSEKLDGVRAYWDGERLISRLGNAFQPPEWFLRELPRLPLDGELWVGRKQFQRTVSIVRRMDRSEEWRDVQYVVFDSPGMEGPFEERCERLREALQEAPPHLGLHPHDRCRGMEHLREELQRVEAMGGEGLMLRQPRSRYESGRSWTLLKVKSFFDAEARVVGHQAGAGRHKGRLGALVVELENGTRFSVGTGFSDAEREKPPPLGSLITFRYQELSDGGVPRFPSYVGVRFDAPGVPDVMGRLREGLARARRLTRPKDLRELRELLAELERLAGGNPENGDLE